MAQDVAENAEADSFIINLRREAGQFPVVASVELLLPEMRNRYSFNPRKPLHEMFAADFADRLEASINRLAPGERIVSLPEFIYEIPGLILAGMRILITSAEDGVEVIMLRFRRYIGAVKSLFRFDPTMTVSSTSTRERIAVDVLEDIISPLFDLLSLDVPGMDEVIEKHAPAIRKRLSQLSMRQEEIVFFTGLLQRYVSGCQDDAQRKKVENRGGAEPQAQLPRTA